MQEWKRDVVMVNPAELLPHPRRDEAGDRYDSEEALDNLPANLISLQANILQNGIREPLLAQQGTNTLITGHFRRAVALSAGWTEVPVQLMNISDDEMYWMMLADNWERNDSIMDDPMAIARNMYYFAWRLQLAQEIEENGADYYKSVHDVDTLSVKFSGDVSREVRKKFDLKRSTAKRYFQLLKLILELQKWLSEKRIGVEGGALLANMSEKAQRDFLRDYANCVKVSDLEIKSFKDTWQDINEEQKEQLAKSWTDEFADASAGSKIGTNDNEAETSEETDVHNVGENDQQVDDNDEDGESDGEWIAVEPGTWTGGMEPKPSVSNASTSMFVVDLDELPSISVVDDPKHKSMHMRNKLARLVKRQKGVIHRMNGELRDLLEGLKEDAENKGFVYIMEDVAQLERDVRTMLGLIDKAKTHHQEATDRRNGTTFGEVESD